MRNEIDQLSPLFDALMFFSVSGEEIKLIGLRNRDFLNIDCNIYHPKYGKKYEGTFRYNDPNTGEEIACLAFHEVICVLENGTYTNKDGDFILETETNFRPPKTATTESEFQEVYNREWKRSQIENEVYFQKFLLEVTISKEEQFQNSLSNKARDSAGPALETFYTFKEWLKRKIAENDVEGQEKSDLQKFIDGKIPKLKWTGSRKQLYDVFKQLRNDGHINNSIDEIAEFIIAFMEFEDGKMAVKSTITAQLNRKDNRPIKSKRINLRKE